MLHHTIQNIILKISIDSLEKEEHLIIISVDENGNRLHSEFGEKLFNLKANVTTCNITIPQHINQLIENEIEEKKEQLIDKISNKLKQLVKTEKLFTIKWSIN